MFVGDGKQIETLEHELSALKSELSTIQKEKEEIEKYYSKNASKSYQKFQKQKSNKNTGGGGSGSDGRDNQSQMIQITNELDKLRKENENLKDQLFTKDEGWQAPQHSLTVFMHLFCCLFVFLDSK